MYDFSKLLTARVFVLSCERSHIGFGPKAGTQEKRIREPPPQNIQNSQQQHRTRAAVEAEEDGGGGCTDAVKRPVTRSEDDLRASDGRKDPLETTFFLQSP